SNCPTPRSRQHRRHWAGCWSVSQPSSLLPDDGCRLSAEPPPSSRPHQPSDPRPGRIRRIWRGVLGVWPPTHRSEVALELPRSSPLLNSELTDDGLRGHSLSAPAKMILT